MAASPPVEVTAVEPSQTRMIVVLGLLVALGPLTIDMYLPALPRIADELGLTSSVAQLTLTGTLAGLALGQLVVGPLSDSLGRRRPLVAGILLHMVASVLGCSGTRYRDARPGPGVTGDRRSGCLGGGHGRGR